MTATISYEFFPPRTLDASFRLWDTLSALHHTDPEFVSVTYGAGGTTRQLTHEAVETIGKRAGLNVAAHLTCVDASREETLAIADRYAEAGVDHIVALRGDPPKGEGAFRPREDGFSSSVELVEALAKTGKFELTVGAYPDPHPEAANATADVEWLKRKVDAGASRAITQFFFDRRHVLSGSATPATEAGIKAQILPGILPIQSWAGVRKFARALRHPDPRPSFPRLRDGRAGWAKRSAGDSGLHAALHEDCWRVGPSICTSTR